MTPGSTTLIYIIICIIRLISFKMLQLQLSIYLRKSFYVSEFRSGLRDSSHDLVVARGWAPASNPGKVLTSLYLSFPMYKIRILTAPTHAAVVED